VYDACGYDYVARGGDLMGVLTGYGTESPPAIMQDKCGRRRR